MRRFVRTFKIGNRIVKLNIIEFNLDKDVHEAIGSGIPWKEPQYLLLDYDENYQKTEWKYIVEMYSLRRGLIFESSPERYWFTSFSPMHIADIAEIMFHSSADKKHCAHLLKEGAVYLRYDQKQKGYPKVVDVINNPKGINFYNFDAEKVYRKELIGGDKE
jgi:hypothetical protein